MLDLGRPSSPVPGFGPYHAMPAPVSFLPSSPKTKLAIPTLLLLAPARKVAKTQAQRVGRVASRGQARKRNKRTRRSNCSGRLRRREGDSGAGQGQHTAEPQLVSETRR